MEANDVSRVAQAPACQVCVVLLGGLKAGVPPAGAMTRGGGQGAVCVDAVVAKGFGIGMVVIESGVGCSLVADPVRCSR